MTSHHIKISYSTGNQWRDLPPGALRCAQGAVEALEKSYAPYSKFNVGAALLSINDDLILGSNQENAAYPHCLCAEQVCVHHYHHAVGDHRPLLMAIAVRGHIPALPCGGCRQVLHEWTGRYTDGLPLITLASEGPYMHFDDVRSLLPLAFTPHDLNT